MIGKQYLLSGARHQEAPRTEANRGSSECHPFKKNSQEFQMMAVSKELLRAVADHRGLKELKIGGPALASFQHGEHFSCKI